MGAKFEEVRQYTEDFDVLFLKCQEAIVLCGFTVREHTYESGYIKAKVGFSWKSYGENLELYVNRDGVVKARSECWVPTQVLDWGKNKANLQKFFEVLTGLLGAAPPTVTKAQPAISPGIDVVNDELQGEQTEVIDTEELPLDNRFGSQPLSVEHEFSRTTTNTLSVDSTRGLEGSVGMEMLKIIEAKVSLSFSQRTGESIGESVTRRCQFTFTVNPGDFVIYKVVWKRKRVSGEFEVVMNQRHVTIPYTARFGLEYEVVSSNGKGA